MPLPGILAGLFKGKDFLDAAGKIVDDVVTTKEERELLKIKLEEMAIAHQEKVMSNETELVKAYLQDVDSARNREIETTKAGANNYTQQALAYIGVASFFAITTYIIARGIGEMSTESSFIVGNLTGMAAAIAKDIYGYYFGSSAGSANKDQVIKKMGGK